MTIIRNVRIFSQGNICRGEIIIDGNGTIADIIHAEENPFHENENDTVYDGKGFLLLPGIIDTHVHFRDPGLTRKGDLESESRAAAAGGVTTVLDMPNTLPPTVNEKALLDKMESASKKSCIHCGFFIGATEENASHTDDFTEACGIKLFLGSSTGNMVLTELESIEKLFRQRKHVLVVHCEDDGIISENMKKAIERYGEDIPFRLHPYIRSREACIKATGYALEMAVKYGTRLHIAHVSTAEEVKMIARAKKLNPDITAETCVNYIWFDDFPSGPEGENIYDIKKAFVKCNPSIKTEKDRKALLKAVINGTIDSVATDHAPHLEEEKMQAYGKAPSGMPSIQHSLQMMLTISENEPSLTIGKIVELMCGKPSEIFSLGDRGRIARGLKADFVLVNPEKHVRVVRKIPEIRENDLGYSVIAYKCGWSPIENEILRGEIVATFVEGKPVYQNEAYNL